MTLILLMPTSLVYNWEKEFTKFGSELNYKTVSDTKSKRLEVIESDTNMIMKAATTKHTTAMMELRKIIRRIVDI